MHTSLTPSDWVVRWSKLLRPKATVLDVACGSGRHVRYLAGLGHQITGVDRDALALSGLASVSETILADIENGPWPLAGRQFDAVVVTNYLWRAVWPQILACLAPGGVLIYETFAVGNESVGKPSRPDFLLQKGELLQRCADMRVVAFEEGFLPSPERFVQRIAAVNQPPDPLARYLL
jgi:SAM-dependent methyltransferase